MVSLNADNNTSPEKSQETNFDVVKRLIKIAWDLDITPLALRLLLYQIDQEFCFVRNGKVKDGDVIGHLRRSRHLKVSRQGEIDATMELEKRNIIQISRSHHATNRYHINRDITTWILSSATNVTSDTPDTIRYKFSDWQVEKLIALGADIETEELWLNSLGVAQNKAFATLVNKLGDPTK
jgi:hypothetical protein